MKNIQCHKCSHEWLYKGKSEFYVTCPRCTKKTPLNKEYGANKAKSQTVQIDCHLCGYVWEYGGNSDYYITCPRCMKKTKLKRFRLKEKPEQTREEERENESVQEQTKEQG